MKNNNPNAQSHFVFGPSRCGIILREILMSHEIKHLYRRFLAFYNLSRRTINAIELKFADDAQMLNRVRQAYIHYRIYQLENFCGYYNMEDTFCINRDTIQRMAYVIGEKLKPREIKKAKG